MPTPTCISFVVALATGGVFAAADSIAQDAGAQAAPPSRATPAQPVPRSFEDLDTNADGIISKDEAAVDPPLAQMFGTRTRTPMGGSRPRSTRLTRTASPDPPDRRTP